MKENVQQLIAMSQDRFAICSNLINQNNLSQVAELGVAKGDFAKKILEECSCIEQYTMVDPWRNLSDWNKPANKDDTSFEEF